MPLTARGTTRDVYLGPKYKVLVVDDSALTRKMLVKTLKASGHETVEAEDGSKGVERMEDNFLNDVGARPFDCVLMDFVMPVMDGPTATKEIRTLGYTAPIFGVTGNCLESDIKRFKDNGATDVFPKPFIITEFHRTMDRLRAKAREGEGKN
jgi:CheY-like chemotaxis protein